MYAGPAGVLFVEYKYVKTLPKRDDTVIKHSLSALQVAWLERMSQSTNVALVLGVANTAIILERDFSTNISKLQYIEQNISRRSVADWIYSITHAGTQDEEGSPTVSKKPT